uniref:type II secretion system F family protein n=1 Tax=Thaumasiovibrio occultus TaxID=1891184 RepID=UPI000B34F624|nr:type II secretion system F family protein [Thaumasiovibrio occultus]
MIGIAVLGIALAFKPKAKGVDYLRQQQVQARRVDDMTTASALDMRSLVGKTFRDKVSSFIFQVKTLVGEKALLKVFLFWCVVAVAGLKINEMFINANKWLVIATFLLFATWLAWQWLKKRERQRFNDAFPDALNLLAGAVTAGESLMHAIIFVGKSLDNTVGREFKFMGERLQIGEPPDEVFAKACHHFPYQPFYFFIITLRANMNRGGQLKDVMMRLNRLMFDSRALEKKKAAMTSEARMSAKIVAAIPFCFILLLKYMSPENYEFITANPAGKPILYYLLISEAIGIGIIWWLMRGASE